MTISEKGKGLWHNIHMKRKRGEKPRKPGSKGAPKPGDFDRARGESVKVKSFKEFNEDN